MYSTCNTRSAAFLLLILTALAGPAQAQIAVTGRVLDGEGAPVALANVQLLVQADSSFAAGTMADEEGRYRLDPVAPGDYLLYVSLLGYEDYLSGGVTLTGSGEERLPPVTLHEGTLEMQEVTVAARRALYEQQGDRLIVNVGTSVTLAGATALQVIERSPGVVVNRLSNTLSLLGKDGVRLMINGKLSHIPAGNLVQYLSGLSADTIERIEFITSPPPSSTPREMPATSTSCSNATRTTA